VAFTWKTDRCMARISRARRHWTVVEVGHVPLKKRK
jgi:hypothetical protein